MLGKTIMRKFLFATLLSGMLVQSVRVLAATEIEDRSIIQLECQNNGRTATITYNVQSMRLIVKGKSTIGSKSYFIGQGYFSNYELIVPQESKTEIIKNTEIASIPVGNDQYFYFLKHKSEYKAPIGDSEPQTIYSIYGKGLTPETKESRYDNWTCTGI